MLLNNGTCVGLDTIPPFLPASLLFAVFGIFIPWAVIYLPNTVTALKDEPDREEKRVRRKRSKVVSTVVSNSAALRAADPDITKWTASHIGVVVMLFLAAVGGGVFFGLCFCGVVQGLGIAFSAVAFLTAVFNAVTGLNLLSTVFAGVHKFFACVLGVGAIVSGVFLVVNDYENNALSWAVLVLMLLSAFMMGVTVVRNWAMGEESYWGSWTSHYERMFFLAFAVLLAGVPLTGICT